MDSLLSIVQMPAGVPVGTLAIGQAGAINAAPAGRGDPGRTSTRSYPAGGRTSTGAGRPQAVLTHPNPDHRRRPRRQPHDDRHPRRRAARPDAGPGRLSARPALPLPRPGRRVPGRGTSPTPPRRVRGLRRPSTASAGARRRHLRVRERAGRVGPLAGRARRPSTRRRTPWRSARTGSPRRRSSRARRSGRRRSRPSIAGGPRRRGRRIGLPAVLKTRRFGYDGKGQAVLRTAADVEAAWAHARRPAADPRRVRPVRPRAVDPGRPRPDGELAFYPLVENLHRARHPAAGTSPAPGPVARSRRRPSGSPRESLEALGYVGVLAIEFFQVGGRLLANEMAPRVHNSGHWTIEGAETSQFENHLRAVAGLPLGSTARRRPVGMVNLIGGWPDPARRAGHPRGPPAPVRQAAAAGPEGRPHHGAGRFGWGTGRAGPTGAGADGRR